MGTDPSNEIEKTRRSILMASAGASVLWLGTGLGSAENRPKTFDNHVKKQCDDEINAEFPPASSAGFERKLRKVVGADRDQDWKEFVDSEGERNVHDIRNYGAAVDGSTNDRQAIVDAINAAVSEDPTGIVYLPEGKITYGKAGIRIDASYNDLSIVGEGYNTVLKPDTGLAGEPEREYQDMGIWFSDASQEDQYKNITLANFRMVGDDVGSKLIGGRYCSGKDNKIINIWAENTPGQTSISHTLSGCLLADITVRGAGEHGIAINNGIDSDPTEEKIKSINPNPVYARRLYVTDSGAYKNSRYAIDVSSGAHILVDKFIAEDNHNLGMKVPKVRNVRIYNGFFKNNANKDFQTLDSRWKFQNAYLHNVRVEADKKNSNTDIAVSFGQGDWTIGQLVVKGGKQLTEQVKIADSIDELEFKADTIISKGSGGDGVLIEDTNNGFQPEIGTLVSKGHEGCDLRINGGDVTIEKANIGRLCGDRFTHNDIDVCSFPSVNEIRDGERNDDHDDEEEDDHDDEEEDDHDDEEEDDHDDEEEDDHDDEEEDD